MHTPNLRPDQRDALKRIIALARLVATNAPALLIEPAIVRVFEAVANFEDARDAHEALPSITPERAPTRSIWSEEEARAAAENDMRLLALEEELLIRVVADPTILCEVLHPSTLV